LDFGQPSSYLELAEGRPVFASDGAEIGRVKRVLAAEDEDIFEGLIVDTDDGDRFVAADQVDEIYERGVALRFDAAQARRLPAPEPSPPALEVEPEDTVKRSPLKRLWDYITGNY
jgi:sporulation protein YlmC with PRC-barrel domain